jgi:hypothetical protein
MTNEDNIYELQPIQANLDDIKSPIEQVKEDGNIGLNWDQWIECVQFMAIRYTSGTDTPSSWGEVKLRAMYQDLQYFTYEDVQKAIIRLHEEGRSFAPNSSQIIGKLNALNSQQVMSASQIERLSKGQYSECKGGAQHEWADWGWFFDEQGYPMFLEVCCSTLGPNMPTCLAERTKSNPSEANKSMHPGFHMTREKFIESMKKLKLSDKKQDELLEYRNRLLTEEEVAKLGVTYDK